MSKVIVDIETVGFDFEDFPEKKKEYLLKYASSDQEKEEIKKKTGLYPLTGEIVTIGLLNPETMKGLILFQNKKEEKEEFEEGGVIYKSGSEDEILRIFWEKISSYRQIITFNGRGFDAPFLMLRSAMHKIRPSKNLMGYRYEKEIHCDLMEQLTFYGAVRKYSLDFYAGAFGIKSSKDGGVDGSLVGELYKQGKCLEVARYCLGDLVATKELYDFWNNHLNF